MNQFDIFSNLKLRNCSKRQLLESKISGFFTLKWPPSDAFYNVNHNE